MYLSRHGKRQIRRFIPNRHTPRARHLASVTDVSVFPQPGSRLHGFTLHNVKHMPELELTAAQFSHEKTGAEYLHVAREDKNNVFAIGFKTNPPDATGVPHILEHVTLCGSEKYPVRDPFFKMLPRSLQNFMNAFTSSHYTFYPFATTNEQDLKNLMDVYLDATLRPLLRENDFYQEGWRVGPENPLALSEVPDSKDLVFKGVVYNEMKGQMSDAMYLYYIRFMEHMFPALNNSGGDPQKMTDLTYEQLRRFHGDHYHPSNSKIMTYGNLPVETHLDSLDRILSRFDRVRVDQEIKMPLALQTSKEITMKGPVDPLTPPDAQFKTSSSWILCDTSDIHETFALQLALTVLLNGYGSPFYQNLIERGLGSDFSPNTGLDTNGPRAIFSIGLIGVTESNVAQVRSAIMETIQEAIQNGIEKEKINGMIHQLELSLKHKKASFGMDLFQRLAPGWFNNINPLESLAWNSVVDHFKSAWAKGDYLEGLLRKYLLNSNSLTFTMVPSDSFASDLASEEANRLKEKIAATVEKFPSEEAAFKHLRERELELLEEQTAGQKDNLDVLPTLHVSDIDRIQPRIDTRDTTLNGSTKIQWRGTGTNGLTYFRALSTFKDLPTELRLLIPLFCDSLMRIGTRDQSMGQLEDLIKLKTGGINFGYHSSTSPHDVSLVEEGFSMSGFALDKNIPDMYELLATILLGTDFDSPKAHGMLKQLLQAGASGAVDGIAESGHSYAMKYSQAGCTMSGAMREQIAGVTQVKLITGLAAAEEDAHAMSELIDKLKTIQAIAVNTLHQGMRIALTCGSESILSNEEALRHFTDRIRSSSSLSLTTSSHGSALEQFTQHGKTFFPLPYLVSYAAQSVLMGPYASQKTAASGILAKLLTHKHLHHEIREKGGAYGGGAAFSGLSGTFNMYSYRDPNPENTLRIMSDAGRWAAEREWSERELEEAKLSIFQAWDAPVSVDQEGMSRFLSGIDGDLEQQRREWYLDVDGAQVRAAADELALHLAERSSTTLLGERKAFLKETDGWQVKEMGLA